MVPIHVISDTSIASVDLDIWTWVIRMIQTSTRVWAVDWYDQRLSTRSVSTALMMAHGNELGTWARIPNKLESRASVTDLGGVTE